MKIHYKALSVIIAFLGSASMLHATTRKVLFIGNSYTYTNSMPTMLQSFAAANGDTLIFDMSAPGGYTLEQHSTDATTLAKIASQKWDIVVIQEQSQRPAFPPGQVETDVLPYAARLDTLIRNNDTCTQTMFMMTWGHRGGDPSNCAGYPVICTYEGMQGRLRESYTQMTMENHAIMAPVGAAWKVMVDSFPAIDLYNPDNSHPSVTGSYLQTCVLYSSIFHKKSLGCTYLSGLPATTVQTLQRIADKVTMDSLTQWQQYGHYPYASFSHTATAASTRAFTNHSLKAVDYLWSFGDGHNDTAANPTHTYTAAGVYTVSLTAQTDCFSETVKETIHVGTVTAVNAIENSAQIKVAQAGHGKVIFMIPGNTSYNALEVFDGTGRKIKKYLLNSNTISDELLPGIYVFRAYSADGATISLNKFIVLP